MSKKSIVCRNLRRIKIFKLHKQRRDDLRKRRKSKNISIQERFDLTHELSTLPRDSAQCRIRNRCALSGRGRGYYRRFGISRINLRNLSSFGILPGVIKASW